MKEKNYNIFKMKQQKLIQKFQIISIHKPKDNLKTLPLQDAKYKNSEINM